jgi:hypothetical protein
MIAWEEGLVAFACVLEEVHAERDASRVHADAVLWDFSPRRACPVPGPNSLPTLVRHWRNAKYFFAYRRWTWKCVRQH